MLPIYVFALMVGGGLLLFSLLGGDDGGDVDADASHGENPIQILSLRTLTYFLFVFGGVGTALSWTWRTAGSLPVLLLSAGAGLAVGTIASAVFGYLRRTDSGARRSEESFVGLTARVSVPIASGGIGKVLVHRDDRAYELLARPFDASATGSTDWTAVVVVEMRRGIALVAPLDDPTLLENSSSPSDGEIGK